MRRHVCVGFPVCRQAGMPVEICKFTRDKRIKIYNGLDLYFPQQVMWFPCHPFPSIFVQPLERDIFHQKIALDVELHHFILGLHVVIHPAQSRLQRVLFKKLQVPAEEDHRLLVELSSGMNDLSGEFLVKAVGNLEFLFNVVDLSSVVDATADGADPSIQLEDTLEQGARTKTILNLPFF